VKVKAEDTGIAPLYEATSSQKCSGMAHVIVKGCSFTCIPTRLYHDWDEPYLPCLPSQMEVPISTHGFDAAFAKLLWSLVLTSESMKDCDSISNDDHQSMPISSFLCTSNGSLAISNGTLGGKATCRRRATSGGSGRCSVPNGTFCNLAVSGHFTAPRVDQPLIQPVPLDGQIPAGHVDDDGWAVPTRVQILRDVANLCTFAGAILATLAMACMWKGRYEVL